MGEKLITLGELAQKYREMREGEVILDVRNPDEFQQMHIPGAINLPLPDLEQTYEKLRDYKVVYIHCKMGGRAKKAFELLTSLGLDNVHCLQEAGIVAWEEAGHPVNKP